MHSVANGEDRTYYSWFQSYSPTQPSYIPEYQGGAFDPWGGYSYDNCAALTGAEFSDVFYKTLIAQKVSLISLYMVSNEIYEHPNLLREEC